MDVAHRQGEALAGVGITAHRGVIDIDGHAIGVLRLVSMATRRPDARCKCLRVGDAVGRARRAGGNLLGLRDRMRRIGVLMQYDELGRRGPARLVAIGVAAC